MKQLIPITLLSIFFCIHCCYAQDTDGRLQGVLVDEQEAPVVFAKLTLSDISTGQFIEAQATDDSGRFCFTEVHQNVRLQAVAIGFDTLQIICGPQDLGIITLTSDIRMLEAVNITASRTTEKGCQYIVVPDTQRLAESGITLNYLNSLNLPGLVVDVPLQSITINGGVPIFQIDGREVSASRLIHLDPNRIRRIEYRDNAGIRYLDRGAAGIINIILTEPTDGGEILAKATTAFTTGFNDAYVRGDYHWGKSEIALEYQFSRRNYTNVPYFNEDKYLHDNLLSKRTQDLQRPFGYTNHYLNIEYTYQHNDSSMFVATLGGGSLLSHSKLIGNTTTLQNDLTIQTAMTDTVTNQSISPSLELYYIRKLKKGRSIEFDLSGAYSQARYEDCLTYNNGQSYNTNTKNNGYVISGEALYGQPLGKAYGNIGLQYQHNFASNDYILYDAVDILVKDNAYAYLGIQGPIGGKIYYSIGTGAKLFSTQEGDGSKYYVRNLSTVQLNWNIAEHWSAILYADYSPDLPSLSSLSPIMQRVDEMEATTGNPSLRPAQNMACWMQLRYAANKKFITLKSGYFNIFNPMVDLYHYDSELSLFVKQPHNGILDDQAYIRMEAGMQDIWNWLNISVSGKFKGEHSKGTDYEHYRNNFSCMVSLLGHWHHWVAGANFGILPEWTLSGETYMDSERSQSVFVQYQWKNLYLFLMWHCPFNAMGYKYESFGLSDIRPSHYYNYTKDNGNMVVLGVTWQINFGKEYNKLDKNLQNSGYDDGIVKTR